ncbi:MAG: hypothetical protein JWO06_1168, partial [Bacteroidota bacterium]|nr:hypothetical protein [Bacteroidota bacterium]
MNVALKHADKNICDMIYLMRY